ncbi:MAG: alanine racemase [Candidatus Margulisbacteria bacterium]|nr:alanine racemase [Candidatus Margulisiibacteriota bacterium]
MAKTIAEINLAQYSNNLLAIKQAIKPSIKIMAVVKADAYGLGAQSISARAEKEGVSYLGVATVWEGQELRESGITIPILVLSEPEETAIDSLFTFNLTPTVYSSKFLKILNQRAVSLADCVKVHIKVDTGMGRIGCQSGECVQWIVSIQKLHGIELEGLYSHFANADQPSSTYSLKQLVIFQSILEKLKKRKIQIPLIHMANSHGTYHFVDSHFDMVRIGISGYKNIVTLKNKVIQIRRHPKGNYISYGNEYCTKEQTWIATVSMGYADGLPISLGKQGRVLIGGNAYPIAGRITMDMTMVDLGPHLPRFDVGEEVVFLGKQISEEITIDEICQKAGIIPYEFLCGIGKRVKRIYL